MQLQNSFIYTYTELLAELIIKDTELKLPVKVNYIIQKNYKTLLSIYQELAQYRAAIFNLYNTGIDEDGTYHFDDPEKLEQANKEMLDLMEVTQEVNILKFNFESLPGDLILSNAQMEVLMFMIEGEE